MISHNDGKNILIKMQQSRDNVELRISAGEKFSENLGGNIGENLGEKLGVRLGYNPFTLTCLVFLSSVINKVWSRKSGSHILII